MGVKVWRGAVWFGTWNDVPRCRSTADLSKELPKEALLRAFKYGKEQVRTAPLALPWGRMGGGGSHAVAWRVARLGHAVVSRVPCPRGRAPCGV